MLLKVPVLLFGCLLGYVIAQAPAVLFSFLVSLLPGVMVPVAALILGGLVEATRCAVIGFIFWSGTNDSWKAAGLWAFLGATACQLAFSFPMVSLITAHPVLIASVLLFRAAGAWLGAWYSDQLEHHPVAQNIREGIFRFYPFRLPAP